MPLLLPAAVLWYCAAADLDVAAVAAVDADALGDEAAKLPRDVVDLRQLAPPALVVVVAEERLQQVSQNISKTQYLGVGRFAHLHHGHPVGGEGARLVRADSRGVPHRLARVQVPHQVVVSHHFLERKKIFDKNYS